jgi:FMN reductase [NAD(P)H]
MMDFCKSISLRRTIRKYKSEPLDENMLNELLELSMRTQTMGNLQLYSVVMTKDEETKRRLAPAHFNQPMVTQAPVVLTVCADFNRTSQWCRNRMAEPGYDNLLSFMNAASDALLYAQTFCNLAEAKGLGICYLGTTLYNPQAIIDALGLPRLVMPVATLTIGWPDEEPELSDRLPLEAILHNERYTDYDAGRIGRFYAHKESLPENKHFVEINNKQTLAQVFTDLRYTKQDNEAMSQTFLEALRKQGFLS